MAEPARGIRAAVPRGHADRTAFAARKVPAQSQSVDGGGIFKKAPVPANAAGDWEIELAPLSRMNAWGFRNPRRSATESR